jgi:glyoxylase I family protein
MEKVLGFGGVFFRAKNTKALAEWYEKNLGVTKTPTDYGTTPWFQTAGPTVFGVFKEDSKYFPAEKTAMWNFRVKDLDAMVKQLRGAGIKVDVDPELYPNGRFARLYDPENNAIELWQPNGPYSGL